MDEHAPIVVTRGAIGQWASFVGGAGLLLGLLALLWQGEPTNFAAAALGIGVLGMIVWGVMTPDEFAGFFTGRQIRHGTAAVFSVLLVIGIFGMIYILVEDAVITVDMTEGRFTLSSESLEILRSVQRPIQITGFYSSRLVQQREIDDQFFRLYEDATNGLVRRVYIDPDAQPAIADAFQARDGEVFISFLNPDGTIDYTSLYYVPLTGTQERDITQAISRLLFAGSITIYFDLSLGELDPIDNTQRGLSIINNLARENGIITQPIDLVNLAENSGDIPPGATAIILARPVIDPPEGVIRLLDTYLRTGGSLFIMADTQTEFMTAGSPFNEYMWNNYGLRMMDAVVVDEFASGATPLDVISAIIFTSEISVNIDPQNDPQSATQFRLARPIEVNDDPPVPNGRIIMSSEGSYAETALEALFASDEYRFDPLEDTAGPLTTVAFAHDQATGAKILLVGDSDFVTNGQISSPQGNAYLFTDGLSWLTGFAEQVGFTPRSRVSALPLIFINTQTLDRIAFFTVVVMPGAMLLAGAFVWFRRSRL